MKKIIRLTESDLTRIIKRVIQEQHGENYSYTQKNGHSLISKNGKRYDLPAGHVWNHQCMQAEEQDWLEDSKYGIRFDCGDLGAMSNNNVLKNYKNSAALVSALTKEFCSGGMWNSQKYPSCFEQGVKERQNH